MKRQAVLAHGFSDLLFSATRVLWLAYGLFLWVYWLASVPLFLQLAKEGTLPTTVVDGLAPAQVAIENAATWGTGLTTWSWINVVTIGFSFLVFSLIGLLIWRRVPTGFGLLTAYVLLVGGSAAMNITIYSAELSPIAFAAWQFGSLIWPLFFLWLYLFPNGRAIPRRLRWMIGPVLAVFLVGLLLSNITDFLSDSSPFSQAVFRLQPLFEAPIIPLFLLVVGAQIYRYFRVSSAAERKQSKWFLFGLLVAFIPLVLLNLVLDYPAELDTLAFIALPVGIGISILRYRLWDIDVIIRKTAVYTILTALLALVYFGLVILLQNIFEAVSGQRSPIIIVISTLIIAALFAPLRRQVQDFIDRRFYRRKYDAQKTLAAFARFVRDETDLTALRAELLRVTQETMQPEQVSIWLKEVEQ
jgi:hypothetical protein